MSDIDLLEELIDGHLQNGSKPFKKNWKIGYSDLEGRGIFAIKDIEVGEIIFKDSPLVTGPRVGLTGKLHCVVCLKVNNLKACNSGCGLPVCSLKCQENMTHKNECSFIKNHNGNFNEITMELFRSITPIRALLMDENQLKLVLQLANHLSPKHGFEIKLIKSKLELNESEEDLLTKICCVLDANAYETMVESTDTYEEFSLRALYPVGALLNHNCIPNTTHLFDENQKMVLKSTISIPQGTEVLTSYTSLLWGTSARQQHLLTTKHFHCKCQRCQDPTECNSGLSGLKCTSKNKCDGVLYPIEPMNEKTKWKCNICGLLVSRSGIGLIQSTLGSMLGTFGISDLKDLVKVVEKRINHVVPPQNQIACELKIRVIWMLGKREGYLWNEVSIEYLNLKEKLCKELLVILDTLGTGECKLKGLLLCELYGTLTEIHKRKIDITEEETIARQNLLRDASEILYQDFRAPIEVKLYIENCHSIL